MAIIRILQPHTANQIAAGEVVERPASVIKELVENAIDAGATAVSIEIQDGGIRSMVVSDNGCGIAADDCEAAFLRHATSKIHSIEDLSSLHTMGFRGEALASIASVSSVEMMTRTKDSDTGSHLLLEHGGLTVREDAACSCGTSISVNELFAGVPARLKFLKSARTEAGYVGDYVARLILSHPEISFRYLADGNTVYETYGDGDLFNAIFCVYGASVTDRLLRISYDNAYLRLDGYIGRQELNRPNRSFQSLFVNGRYIRSLPISGSVMRAYDTRLMGGRFPFFVLNLTISPQEMDVNVHPSKLEVRFADEQRVTGAVYAACRDALSHSDKGVEILSQATVSVPMEQKAASDRSVIVPPVQERMFFEPKAVRNELHENAGFSNFKPEPALSGSKVPTIRIRPSKESAVYHAPEPVRILSNRDVYQVVGCLFRTYWVVTADDAIYLIDQHAAHERQLYERFCKSEVSVSGQQILLPLAVTLTPSEMEMMKRYRDDLISLGFSWDITDILQIELTATPVLNGMTLREEFLHEALVLIGEKGRDVPFAGCRDRIIRSACKHAIKAGEEMSEEEIRNLMQEYADASTPLTCPHGRPIVLQYHRRDLEKMFKRIL